MKIASRRMKALAAMSLALAGLGLGGCAALGHETEPPGDEAAEPALGETEQALSPFDWSTTSVVEPTAPNLAKYAQVGNIAGRIIMVNLGPTQATFDLFWRERDPSTGIWSSELPILGQASKKKVSLAAFNGFLYMVRTDANDPLGTTQRMSRFDPTNNTWSTDFQIAHTSYNGPPALAVYNGSLYLIGVDPATKRLWWATMNTAGVISNRTLLLTQSESRVSAAVFQCRLYVAHRDGSSNTIVYNRYNGSGWTSNTQILAGTNGAALIGPEPVIAERSNYLHLLHRIPHDGAGTTPRPILWTYYDGATWASEVSVGSTTTFFAPSLVSGGPGLVATSEPFSNVVSSLTYNLPLPPRLPPPCDGVVLPL